MANIIKIKRGLKSNLPNSSSATLGELRYATDTNELFIDTGSENKLINKDYIDTKVSKTNDPIRVYATDTLGNQTTIPYSNTINAGYMVQRDSNAQVIVPEVPVADKNAASKKYVDDGLALKPNTTSLDNVAFTGSYNDLVDTPTYKTINSEIITGTGDIPLQTQLSGTGGNIVTYTSTTGTLGELGFDNAPTQNSNKLVKSGPIWTELQKKINYTDIINNLTTTDTNKPLSAYQGKILDEKITLAQQSTHDRGVVQNALTSQDQNYTITNVTVNNGGTNYTIGDILFLTSDLSFDAIINVTNVDTSGAITSISLGQGGSFTQDLPSIEDDFVGGTGNGAKFNVTTSLVNNSTLASISNPQPNDFATVLHDEIHDNLRYVWKYADIDGDGNYEWVSGYPITNIERNFYNDPIKDGELDTNAVTTVKIANKNVTAEKIADNAIIARHITSGTITDSHIASGADIDQSKIKNLSATLNNKVSRTSIAYQVYGTAGANSETTISYTTTNDASTIVQRDANSQINVALTPTANTNATSKKYVNDQDALKVDKVSGSKRVYGTDSSGNQTTYDYDSFGKVDDVKIGNTSAVTNKIANLGTMAGETATNYYTKINADGTFVKVNPTIVGSTKTKITYDSKGLVTGGTDITIADVTDITASAAEINILDGITATTAELNYVDGVTSNIQTQLNTKAADNAVVHTTGNETISGTKTFNDILELKSNLSFRSYGTNDSGRLQFRAQPSDNVIRGTMAITDGYSTSGSGYDGFVAQMVARSGSTTSDPFNTIRVSNKGIEYIKEANDGTITGQYVVVDDNGLVPSDRLATSGTAGQLLTKTASGQAWQTFEALPSQTGNSGKYLTTNGTSASWNTLATVATSGSYSDLSNKPTISDLVTTTQLAALNSGANTTNVAQITTNKNNISTINGKIPSAATSSNQLADKAFVNSSINAIAAYYITSDVEGDAFATKAALDTGPYYHDGSARTPTENDYAIVAADETHSNACTRYSYTGSQWSFQYIVNDTPFTQAQINAINSGITDTKVSNYDTHVADTTIHVTTTDKNTWNSKQAAITGAASTITSSDLTASRALVSNSSGKVAVSSVTSTELGYVSGVTSNVQIQLNNKQDTISDLAAIRSGAALGATAIQPDDNISELTNDANYQTDTQVSSAISTHNSSISAHSDIRSDIASKSTVSVSATGTATDKVQYITIDGVEKKISGSEEDNVTITKNASDKIQAVGTFNKNTASGATGALYDWVGTLQEYNDQNIKTLHPDWLCYITDDIAGGTSVYTKTETDSLLAHKLNDNQITNCITHIPQDIKLELNNGTLTLKAGSKVYVPNGAGVFDTVTIANDITFTMTWGANSKRLFFVRKYGDVWGLDEREVSFSGGTAPENHEYSLWYDTTNNLIKMTSDYGSTWVSGLSFPIALITNTNNVTTSIDQIFNGFGYIGSTVFVLPGVKGLIPNGRNTDGSLKNTEIAINTVQILTPTQSLSLEVAVILEPQTRQIAYCGDPIYNEAENLTYDLTTKRPYCQIGRVTLQASKITAFTPKTAFHAVDYSNTEYISNQGMPSSKYISLSFSHGASYTAPADGYFLLVGNLSSPTFSNIGGIQNTSSGLGNMTVPGDLTNNSRWFLPVRKGETVEMYLYNGTVSVCRFIYAQGAQ